MAAREYKMDLEIVRPRFGRLRFRIAAALVRLAVRVNGKTSIVTRSAKARSNLLATLEMTYRGTPVERAPGPRSLDQGEATTPTTGDSAPPGDSPLHPRDATVGSDSEGASPTSTSDSPLRSLRPVESCLDCGCIGFRLLKHDRGEMVCWGCFDARQTRKIEAEEARLRAIDKAYEPRLDPANCYDCGQPLGETVVRGRYTHRPYHPLCIGRDRETENASVLG